MSERDRACVYKRERETESEGGSEKVYTLYTHCAARKRQCVIRELKDDDKEEEEEEAHQHREAVGRREEIGIYRIDRQRMPCGNSCTQMQRQASNRSR